MASRVALCRHKATCAGTRSQRNERSRNCGPGRARTRNLATSWLWRKNTVDGSSDLRRRPSGQRRWPFAEFVKQLASYLGQPGGLSAFRTDELETLQKVYTRLTRLDADLLERACSRAASEPFRKSCSCYSNSMRKGTPSHPGLSPGRRSSFPNRVIVGRRRGGWTAPRSSRLLCRSGKPPFGCRSASGCRSERRASGPNAWHPGVSRSRAGGIRYCH